MMQSHSELSARTFVDVHAIQEELDQVRWGCMTGRGARRPNTPRRSPRQVLNLIASLAMSPSWGEISSVPTVSPSPILTHTDLLAQHTREADKLEAQCQPRSGPKAATASARARHPPRPTANPPAPGSWRRRYCSDLRSFSGGPGALSSTNPLFDDLASWPIGCRRYRRGFR